MTKPTIWVCTQRSLRSAWASAQSDQSISCALSRYLKTQAFFMRTAKALVRLGRCPGWSESSLGTQAFCWFVMLRLIWMFMQTKLCTSKTLKKIKWDANINLYSEVCNQPNQTGVLSYRSKLESDIAYTGILLSREQITHKQILSWCDSVEIWASSREPVFGVCDQGKLKPAYAVTEAM